MIKHLEKGTGYSLVPRLSPYEFSLYQGRGGGPVTWLNAQFYEHSLQLNSPSTQHTQAKHSGGYRDAEDKPRPGALATAILTDKGCGLWHILDTQIFVKTKSN